MTVPPARQCTMPTCSSEAVDYGQGGLCPDHLEDLGDTDEGGSPDENPTPNAEKTGSSTPDTPETDGSALADALEWFHQQLDRDLPDECDHETPRDYYRDGRGWDAETIGEKLLGYAPANYKDDLIAHLFDRGHGREEILATGLFGERDDGNLYATWSGRYVLPYFDADGRPVFGISRATEPVHSADWKGNKYDKLQVTREDVTAEEPIYGLDTVRDGEPLLITEGIADAITAHEAGYPCLSPVTTQFKKSDREDLLDALDERDVGRIYLIQDAERPTSNVDDRDRLTLQQFGDGVKGAVKTAAYLDEHGMDARVAELPRPGLAKVDLDDYLQGWSDDLTPLLAGAKPVAHHPAYDPDTARDAALDAAEASDLSRDPDAVSTDGDHSALFDLGIRDVTGLSWDYRGKNPLGHHGDSENYFVLVEEYGLAYDFKNKAAYNALTYLLVDAGERRRNAPNGRLDDSEVFAAWERAKRKGRIPDDDPIPHRALLHVAREHDLMEDGDLMEGWKLPADAYNVALNTVAEEYGLDPGRSPIRTDDAEPVAELPLGKLDALTGADRERFARRRGLSIPSTDDARDRLQDAVFREFRAGNTTVLDAPTALGKSYTVATEDWGRRADVTGEQPVIHLHPTRDARDDAAKKTRSSSATGAVLKGRKERCPVAGGDHDPGEDDDAEDAPDQVITIGGDAASAWFDRQCDGKGLPFSTAHALARERNDQNLEMLPCCEDGDCPAVAQWDGLPRTDDGEPTVDVVHATHQFAYVPSLRRGTNVVLDEQPDFTVGFTDAGTAEAETGRIRSMVSAYLRAIDAPVTTWEAFVSLARFDPTGGRSDAGAEQDALDDALGSDPPTEWYVNDPDAHALAPDLTHAIWRALRWEDGDENGRRSTKVLHEPPRLDADDGEGYAGTWLSVVIDDENTVRTVRSTPDFTQARAVVGLDAHPSMPMWELNGAPGMTRDAVLDPEERRLWRRYERGLTVVQVGDATRPRSGDNAREWMNDERVRAVLERLREQYGDGFDTAITTAQIEPVVRQLLADVTGEDLDAEQTLHNGQEKSRNPDAFADALAGYVYGCMDPGDGMILDALAELDLDAEPATATTDDGDTVREKGRTFDGPDADTARAVLASVRENHVAQAAGRYARSPEDDDDRATVFVHTDAVPAGFADYQVSGVEWLASDTQRAILDELTERPTATTRELADAVGCSKEHVRKTLRRLVEDDRVVRDAGEGDHGADVYRDDGAPDALLDLGLDETTNGRLKNNNRWSLAVWDLASSDRREQRPPTPGEDAVDLASGDGPPPDPAD